MGLFSGKKIITVSSTLYNLAGDEADRPNYMKGTIFSSVMAQSKSLADDLTNSYLSGPGMKQRQFFNYAVRRKLAGLPTATCSNNAPVDPDVMAEQIPVPADPAGLSPVVQNSQIAEGDTEPFVERWILNNHQDRISEDWLGNYEESTGMFSVQFPDGDYFEFEDAEFDKDALYVVARYVNTLPSFEGEYVEGIPETVTFQVDLSEWDEVSTSGNFVNQDFNRVRTTTVTYSDGTPSEITTENIVESGTLNRSVDIYERTLVTEVSGYETSGLYEKLTYTGSDTVAVSGYYRLESVTEETLVGNVIKTTTVKVTGEMEDPSWTLQHDTQEVRDSAVVGGEQVYIYRVGSGNAVLDALATEADTSDFQEFFPFLPLRLDNKSLRDAPYTSNGLFDETKKAYRRSTSNKNINDVLDDIEENDSIDDIDYAYVMYGVSLNVQENACRKYAFNFFEKMIQFQVASRSAISDFQTSINNYNTAVAELEAWENTDQYNVFWDERISRPAVPKISVPPTTTLKLKTNSSLMPSYDIRLQWVHIGLEQIDGVYEYTPIIGNARNANVGEVYFTKGPTIDWTEKEGYRGGFGNQINFFRKKEKSIESIYMYHQVSATQYRRLTIYGLTHYNYIYGGKSVKITAHEALDDSDISGFVVPLHYPTMREMSIVDYTQMATADVHILFNSYEVTKQKWWQSWVFKLLIVILVIVVTVVINPGAFAAGGGLLGGNLAVGAALGLTGTAAIVAGVVANYLAAVIVSQVLSVTASAIFGEKWGALIASLAMFAIGAAISGAPLFSAENLLGLGNAFANGYAGWVQADINEMNADFKEDKSDYEKQMDYINDLLAGLGNDLNFNPLELTSSVYGNGSGQTGNYTPETADEFIRRTTMVGTDIVEMTQSMVYDFVDIQQTLPRN